MTRVEAVIETYKRVGPAMMQTTFVGGLGLFVFSLSTFTPTQRFGTLMLVLLVTALLGDLILLPALLAGPLGRWFRPRIDPSLNPDGSVGEHSMEPRHVSDEKSVYDQATDSIVSTHSPEGAVAAPKAINKETGERTKLTRSKYN